VKPITCPGYKKITATPWILTAANRSQSNEKIFPDAYEGDGLYDVREVWSLAVVSDDCALFGTLLGLRPVFPVRYGGQA
jgi:hypothetical protein